MPDILEKKLPAAMVATGDTTPKPAEQGPPAVTTSADIFKWTKALLLSQTHLSEEQAGLVSFWIISSWFLEALNVLPCLVITGPTHEAMRVMQVLNKLCCVPVLVPGFRRNDLETLRRCVTYLIFEPSLNQRTAELRVAGEVLLHGRDVVGDRLGPPVDVLTVAVLVPGQRVEREPVRGRVVDEAAHVDGPGRLVEPPGDGSRRGAGNQTDRANVQLPPENAERRV